MGLLVVLSVPFLIIAKITGETPNDIANDGTIRFLLIVAGTLLVIHIIASSVLSEKEAEEAISGNDEFKIAYIIVLGILAFFCTDMFLNRILVTNNIFKICMLALLVITDIIHMYVRYDEFKSFIKVIIELIYTQMFTMFLAIAVVLVLGVAAMYVLLPVVFFIIAMI